MWPWFSVIKANTNVFKLNRNSYSEGIILKCLCRRVLCQHLVLMRSLFSQSPSGCYGGNCVFPACPVDRGLAGRKEAGVVVGPAGQEYDESAGRGALDGTLKEHSTNSWFQCWFHLPYKKLRPTVTEPWCDSPRYCRTLVSVLLWDGLGLVDRPVVPSATRIMSTHQPAALDTQRTGRSQYVSASKSKARHVAVNHQPLWQTLYFFAQRTRQREIQRLISSAAVVSSGRSHSFVLPGL